MFWDFTALFVDSDLCLWWRVPKNYCDTCLVKSAAQAVGWCLAPGGWSDALRKSLVRSAAFFGQLSQNIAPNYAAVVLINQF